MSDKTSTPGANESMNREDRRHRRRETFLRTNVGDFHEIEVPEVQGKYDAFHIEFRISPRARAVGEATAKLYRLSLNQFAKATLLRELGLIFEPLDRRSQT